MQLRRPLQRQLTSWSPVAKSFVVVACQSCRRIVQLAVVALAACHERPAPTPATPLVAPALAPDTANVVPTDAANLAIGFAPAGSGGLPDGWRGDPAGTVAVDDRVSHDGRRTVRLARAVTTPGESSGLTRIDPLDVAGSTIELGGFLRTQDVHGFVGLWLREDSDRPDTLAFNNMAKRALAGTNGWVEDSVTIPVHADATKLAWGALLVGDGTAWVADLQLLVDGKPIAQAPHASRLPSVLDSDHEFDGGSKIAPTRPTAVQLDNLITLAKVWGFLKYHHPLVTGGGRHWDYELLRTLPTILAAHDRATADAALVRWIASLGPVARCQTCARLDPAQLAVRPDIAWIDDRTRLGVELSRALRGIYDNRVPDQQYFVALVPWPELHHEPAYDTVALPDAGFQLLGLFRLWNAIQYWAPDRELADSPWDRVLTDSIPQVMAAKSAKEYQRAMAVMIARIRDSHAQLAKAPDAAPPDGDCRLSVEVRFIDRRAVVSRLGSKDAGGIAVGDQLTAIGGVAVDRLVAGWAPYYSASNEPARLRNIARQLTRGECGAVRIDVRRGGRLLHLAVARTDHSKPGPAVHDQPGPAFRLLSTDVAYLKLSAVVAADCPHHVEQAAGTKGLVVDIRNYPAEFVVFALGALLVDKPTPFASVTEGDLSNPGAFAWYGPINLEPAQPHYAGKVVVLVDETSQSQAEYTAMALRVAPGASVVGSTTAGADGNVTTVPLPGGMSTWFSGIGVFYPDHRPTQGVGIVADVNVVPTTAGILAGRDEVLEAGIRQIVGDAVSAAEIQRLAMPMAGSGVQPASP